jgi:hypothetical protein
VRGAKFAKDILSKLFVSLLTTPILFVFSIYYSTSLTQMLSSFDARWFGHFWYLVLISIVLVLIELVILFTAERTERNVIVASVLWLILLALYAWKQLAEEHFPLHWPIWVFFFLYCLIVAQFAALCFFGVVKITMNILAAAEDV